MTMYTDAHVIRGTLETRQRRLTDVLNLADEAFLVLSDVVLEGIDGRSASHSAPHAQVNLGAVLFAVATEAIPSTPELRTPKVPERTLISLPPYSITGQIHLLPERHVQDALRELRGRFIPVTGATFWSESLGLDRVSVPMVAINHARAQILSPYDEGDGS
jgi:hypothetical protein